jgi:hypothetical protein
LDQDTGVSGIGVSGMGVSGIGVSGIGVSGIGVSGMGVSGIGVPGIGVSVSVGGTGVLVSGGGGFGVLVLGGGGCGVLVSGISVLGIGVAVAIPSLMRQFGSALSIRWSPSSSLLLKQFSFEIKGGSIKGGWVSQIVIESILIRASELSRV